MRFWSHCFASEIPWNQLFHLTEDFKVNWFDEIFFPVRPNCSLLGRAEHSAQCGNFGNFPPLSEKVDLTEFLQKIVGGGFANVHTCG